MIKESRRFLGVSSRLQQGTEVRSRGSNAKVQTQDWRMLLQTLMSPRLPVPSNPAVKGRLEGQARQAQAGSFPALPGLRWMNIKTPALSKY